MECYEIFSYTDIEIKVIFQRSGPKTHTYLHTPIWKGNAIKQLG